MCGKEFKPTNGKSLTCSKECSEKRKNKYNLKYQKEHPEKYSEFASNWAKRNKDKVNENARKRTIRDKGKIKVRNSTRALIKKLGIKFEGECMDCKKNTKLQIHHITYTIDDFILICEECHMKRHNKRLHKCVQ